MRSKLLLAAAALLASACGQMTSDVDPNGVIGREPLFFSASYLWRGGDANRITMVNETAGTLEAFQMEPFAHETSLPLALPNPKQKVIAAGNGAYFVTLAEDEYAIVPRGGGARRNPVEIAGEITSVAYEPTAHVMVVVNAFQTMTLLALDESGNVQGSFQIGGLTEDARAIGAGTLLPTGKLAVVAGGTELVVIDVRQSVVEQKAVKTAVEVAGASDIGWISTIPGSESLALALDGGRIVVIDTADARVVSERALTDTEVKGQYRDYWPHFVTQTASQAAQGLFEVVYAGTDGALQGKVGRGNGASINQTWLDLSGGTFTALFRGLSAYPSDKAAAPALEIYRFKLGDAAPFAIDKSEIESGPEVALTPGYIFLQHKSVLGHVERRGYGKTPERASLTGYNVKILRDRYVGR